VIKLRPGVERVNGEIADCCEVKGVLLPVGLDGLTKRKASYPFKASDLWLGFRRDVAVPSRAAPFRWRGGPPDL